MENENSARYFLGANSSGGFYPLTDWIVDFRQARRVLLLKGGPGCGKSTFMKRVGRIARDSGEQVVYYHCGSDAESLDGVALPDKGCIILDATPPQAGAALREKPARKRRAQPKIPGKVSK